MTDSPEVAESRKRFEAWMESRIGCRPPRWSGNGLPPGTVPVGEYNALHIQETWDAWEESRRQTEARLTAEYPDVHFSRRTK